MIPAPIDQVEQILSDSIETTIDNIITRINARGGCNDQLILACERLVCLIANRHHRCVIQRRATVIAQTLFKCVESMDEDLWSDTACSALCSALTTLTRNYGYIKMCDQTTIIAKCDAILSDRKSCPFNHATALRIITAIGFPALFSVDILIHLKQHYAWNKVVFESTTYQTESDRSSTARVHYIGAWRRLLHIYLFRLLPTLRSSVIELFNYASVILDPIQIPLIDRNLISILYDKTCTIGQPMVVDEQKQQKPNRSLRDSQVLLQLIEKNCTDSVLNSTAVINSNKSAISNNIDEQMINTESNIIISPTTINRGQLTPSKRRKRRAVDIFDVPKRFRPNHTNDIIFVFHETDAKAIIRLFIYLL